MMILSPSEHCTCDDAVCVVGIKESGIGSLLLEAACPERMPFVLRGDLTASGCGDVADGCASSKIKPLTMIAAMATITRIRFGMKFVRGLLACVQGAYL